ncbi:hypothetical protein ACOWK8_03405 [Helicobacter pylori]
MWHEKFLKVIPAVVFLFCVLEIFELILVIIVLNKTEKLEVKVMSNLNALKNHAEGMQLEHFQNKKLRIR